jgi:putative ABC transport system permease protein
MSQLTRLTNILQPDDLDRDLQDEQLFHIEARTSDLIELGISPGDAAERARRQFGNRLALLESSREAKVTAWLESVFQDVRFGWLMFRKNPGATLTTVLCLSLTIGAATASFSLLDALLLRPLPVPQPGNLFYLTYDGPGSGGDFKSPNNIHFSYPMLQRFRQTLRGDAELFGVTYGGPFQSGSFDGEAEEPLRTQWISGDGFRILGIHPALGRLFTPDDDRLSGERAIVLSHAYWQRRFNGSADILGRGLTLTLRGANAGRFRIAGVAQKGFSGLEPGAPADIWFPLTARFDPRQVQREDAAWFQIRGRLSEGAGSAQLVSKLQVPFAQMRLDFTSKMQPAPAGLAAFRNARLGIRSADATPSLLRERFDRPLWILMWLAILALVIAGSNVANLSVARAAARDREMEMRKSIGAGTLRLLRQLGLESTMIAGAACLLGLGFACVMAPTILRLLAPSDFPAYLDLAPNTRVLAFVAISGLLTVFLFELGPAARACGIWPRRRSTSSSSHISRPMVAAQAAFSFVVLFLSGLLLISFQKLTNVNPGFSVDRVELFTLGAKDARPERTEAAAHFLDRVRNLPAVESAALSMWGLAGGMHCVQFPVRFGAKVSSSKAGYMAVSPGFFETMQIPLVMGRDFDPQDTDGVIVNQAFVRAFLNGENPLGKSFDRLDPVAVIPQKIVGVVADARYNSLREPDGPVVFKPFLRLNQATLQVRAKGDDPGDDLRRQVEAIDPLIRITGAMSQSTRIANSLLRERLLAVLAAFFAITAMILAAAGLFGVLHYSAMRQTKAIGIRIALGARPFHVARLLGSDLAAMVALGVAIAAGAGLVLAPLLQDFLYGVRPGEFSTLALPLTVLITVCVLAAAPPIVRALRMNPSLVLRED